MSLFKERQQTSKRIIALENQILALKQELANQSSQPVASCDKCESEKLLLDSQLKDLKAELKKVKSDLTRSKNKITKLQDQLSSSQSEE
jgi:chromosome segregation ATPase